MDERLNHYLPAIEMMMCHLGWGFDEACLELGLSQEDSRQLREQRQAGDHPGQPR